MSGVCLRWDGCKGFVLFLEDPPLPVSDHPPRQLVLMKDKVWLLRRSFFMLLIIASVWAIFLLMLSIESVRPATVRNSLAYLFLLHANYICCT